MLGNWKKNTIASLTTLIIGIFYTFGISTIGDVNEDGILSVADVIVTSDLVNHEQYQRNADVNGDGLVNSEDIDCISAVILGGNTENTEYQNTLYIVYSDERTRIVNPDPEAFVISQTENDIEVTLRYGKPNLTIALSGKCSDGRLRVIADTTYTLLLGGLELSSSHAPAINSSSKQKMTLRLQKGTENTVSDGKNYTFLDPEEKASGCICSQGNITIKGSGTLTVLANSKHGIASGKGMRLREGTINVHFAPSDAIHSNKYIYAEDATIIIDGQQQDGMDADEEVVISGGKVSIVSEYSDVKAIKCGTYFSISDGHLYMNIKGDASKGIKAKDDITISGGSIESEAEGNVAINNGDPSYCTIIKGDANVTISGGRISFVCNGKGGKGISSDKKTIIDGGNISMQTHGDGKEYINTDGETDYYTSKCISADSLLIRRGEIKCLSTGVGGKGIVADRYLVLGLSSDDTYTIGPKIDVETRGTCLIDNIDEDLRFGCPKAIKAGEQMKIYSGDIHTTTAGMGGEGVECGKELYIYGGNLECNCFDDGINVGEKLEILGGQVYCNSIDNDGIDSNGSIYIKGGIVASINQKEPNESFDSEDRQFYVSGGIIIGVGSSSVKMDQQEVLYYNTLYNVDPNKPARRGLRLTNGKYVYVMDGDNLMLTIKNKNLARRGFVTVALPEFQENHNYSICQGDEPLSAEKEFFEEKLFFKGEPTNKEFVIDIKPTYNYND